MLCRAEACGCEAEKGAYCAVCAEYRPICPCCDAVYGGHYPTCEVADGYTDCGEGPWGTEAEAVHFAEAESGLPWQVTKGTRGWYVLIKEHDD